MPSCTVVILENIFRCFVLLAWLKWSEVKWKSSFFSSYGLRMGPVRVISSKQKLLLKKFCFVKPYWKLSVYEFNFCSHSLAITCFAFTICLLLIICKTFLKANLDFIWKRKIAFYAKLANFQWQFILGRKSNPQKMIF